MERFWFFNSRGTRVLGVLGFAVLGVACNPEVPIGSEDTGGTGGMGDTGGTSGTGGTPAAGGTSSTGETTGGGTSGSGGTGGGSGTGADQPGGAGRPSRIGLRMLFSNPGSEQPETAGRTCSAGSGIEWDVGRPIEMNGQIVNVASPSTTDFGSTLEDGEHDAHVRCMVMSDGTFSVEGGGIDPQLVPPNGTINFRLSGVANETSTPGANTATISVYTPVTLDMQTQPGFPGCTITTVHEQSPGALWADFTCPALTRAGDPARACHASGTLVIEYCQTDIDGGGPPGP